MLALSPRTLSLAAVLICTPAPSLFASPATGQTAPAVSLPHQSGTVKAVTPHDLVLTNTAGQDFAVTVTPSTRILLVPPGSRDLSAAHTGSVGDIAGGDRAIVNGSAGDTGQSLTATRIIVMKASAIAASHSADQAAWAHGAGGIVRSVDPAAGTITVANGPRTIAVTTSPQTVVRRYAAGSVRFEDAVRSNLADIHPGDQIRVRGQRSADGSSIAAEEIVAGSFSNFSGVLSAVDPQAGTVTLKDLATKRTVTVAVEPQSDLHRLPPGAAQTLAVREHGGEAGAQTGGATEAPAGADHGGAERQGGSAGMDLSRMLSRLPTETLAELKPGDAVMIVATQGSSGGTPVAVTMLSGVAQILAAHPSGETTLSPWSLGGEGAEAEGGEGAGSGGGTR